MGGQGGFSFPKSISVEMEHRCEQQARAQNGARGRTGKSPVQLLVLSVSTVIALVLFLLLISHGVPRRVGGVPWTNFEVFILSIVTIVLIASLVGLILGTISGFCWRTTVSTNPTPITLYTNPPPIGSAEAEFQNEYIPVFPMRQLKPRIDLDQN